jgi:hypothetical protein
MNRAKMQELRARAMRLVSPAMSRLSGLTTESTVPTINAMEADKTTYDNKDMNALDESMTADEHLQAAKEAFHEACIKTTAPVFVVIEPVPLNETPKKSRCYKRPYAAKNSSGSVELLYASQDDLDNFSREQFSFFYGPFHNKDIASLFISEYPKLTKSQARTEYNKRRNEETKASLRSE